MCGDEWGLGNGVVLRPDNLVAAPLSLQDSRQGGMCY